MTDFTPDSRRAELDALDAPPQAQGGAASGEQAPAQEQERPETPAWATPMQAYRKSVQEQATEKAMTWEWSHQAKQRADQAEAELAQHRENLESPDSNQPPEALKAAHDAALERHEQAQAHLGAVGQYEAARLARNLDQPVPGENGGAVTDEGFDTNAAMKMGDMAPDWAKLALSAQEAPKAAAGSLISSVAGGTAGTGRYLSGYQPSDPKNQQSVEIAADLRKIGEVLLGKTAPAMQEYAEKFAVDPSVKDTFLVKSAAMGGGAVPYLLTAGLGTAVAGPYGGIGMAAALAAAQSYGTTYDEAISKGATDETARDAAAVSAMTNGSLMAVPVGGWVMRLPALMRQSMVRSSAELAAHGVVFSTVMQSQKFLDNVIAKSYYDPDRKLSEGLGQDIPEEVFVGAILPGASAGAMKAWRALKEKVTPPKSTADVEAAKTTSEPPTLDDPAKAKEQGLREELALEHGRLEQLSTIRTPEAEEKRQAVQERIAEIEGQLPKEELARETEAPADAAERPSSSEAPAAGAIAVGAIAVGDAVQWTSAGADQFKEPATVKALSPDGKWAFVEGSNTGIPVGELTKAEQRPASNETPMAQEAPPPTGSPGFIRRAIERFTGAAKEGEPETVATAAVKVDGKVYTGGNHLAAVEAAAAARGEEVDNILDKWIARDPGNDGWVTSTGRFVDRQEALKLAKRADQLGGMPVVERRGLGVENLKPDFPGRAERIAEVVKRATTVGEVSDRIEETERRERVSEDPVALDRAVDENLPAWHADMEAFYEREGLDWDLRDEDVRAVAQHMARGLDAEAALERFAAERGIAEIREAERAAQGAGVDAAEGGPGAAGEPAGGERAGAPADRGSADRTGASGGRAGQGRPEPSLREGQAGASPAGRADAAGGARAERLTKQKEFFHELLSNGIPRQDWWQRFPKDLAPTHDERELLIAHALTLKATDPRTGIEHGMMRIDRDGVLRRNPAAFPEAGAHVSDAVRLDRTMRQRERDTGRMVSETVRRMAAELEAANGDLTKIEAVRKAMAADKTLKVEDARDAQAIGAGEKDYQDNARAWFRSLLANRAVEPSDWSRRAARLPKPISPALLAQMSKEALAQGLVRLNADGRLIRTELAFALPNFSPLLGDYVPRRPEDAVRQRLEVREAATKDTLVDRLTEPAPKGKREGKAAKETRIEAGQKAADQVRYWAEQLEGVIGTDRFDNLFQGLKAATVVRGRPKNRIEGADQLKRKEIEELAHLLGVKPTTKMSLDNILKRIQERHDDKHKFVDGVEMAAFAEQGHEQRRAFDQLGFYSNALEQAKSIENAPIFAQAQKMLANKRTPDAIFKATGVVVRPEGKMAVTPEKALELLKAAGVKDAEIKATKLDQFLARETSAAQDAGARPSSSAAGSSAEEGRSAAAKPKSVSRDQIVKYLEQNRVEVRESKYGEIDPEWQALSDKYDALQAAMDRVPFQDLRDRDRMGRVGALLGRFSDWRYDRLLTEHKKVGEELEKFPDPPKTKWSQYSLDPSNPTYRETVIHLPEFGNIPREVDNTAGGWGNIDPNAATMQNPEFGGPRDRNFRQGHFSEPNVIAHARTSLQKDAQGKPSFLIENFQSDWGERLTNGVRNAYAADMFGPTAPAIKARIADLVRQIDDLTRSQFNGESAAARLTRLGAEYRDARPSDRGEARAAYEAAQKTDPRHALAIELDKLQRRNPRFADLTAEQKAAASKAIAEDRKAGTLKGGIRDEAKIAELEKRRAELRDELEASPHYEEGRRILRDLSYRPNDIVAAMEDRLPRQDAKQWLARQRELAQPFALADAELRTAKAATPGHPLVNTTDQWVTTGLRRVIRQAVEAGADSISITPSGPLIARGEGTNNPEAMRKWQDERLPKEIVKLLSKMDPSVKGWESKPLQSSMDGRTFAHSGGEEGRSTKKSGTTSHAPILFHTFPLTDGIKASVLSEGMPLFSFAGRGRETDRGVDAGGRPSSSEAVPADLHILDHKDFVDAAKRVPTTPRDVGPYDLVAERSSGYVNYYLVKKGRTSAYDRNGDGDHEGRFSVKASLNGGIEITNASVQKSAMRRKGIGTKVYDLVEKDFAPIPLMPSPWNQLSEDAVAFWSKRSPERLAYVREQEKAGLIGDMYPDRKINARSSAEEGLGRVQPGTPSHAPILSLPERESAARKVMESPEWKAAAEKPVDATRDTSKQDGYGTAEWLANRKYLVRETGLPAEAAQRPSSNAQSSSYKIEKTQHERGVDYVVRDSDGKEIGNFGLRPNDDGTFSVMKARSLTKRAGVATFAYDTIERDLAKDGKKLRITQAEAGKPELSDEGFAFWLKRNPRQLLQQLESASPEMLADHPDWIARAKAASSAEEGRSTPEAGGNVSRSKEIVGFHNAVDHLAKSATDAVPGGVANDRKAYILIGYPGAGKSTIGEAISKTYKAARVVGDDNKALIPEYEGGKNNGGVKKESDRLAAATAAKLAGDGANLVLETSGKPSSVETRAADLKALGYTVSLVHIDVPKAIAMERAVERFKQEGRPVPIDNYDAVTPGDAYAKVQRDGTVDETARITQDEAQGGWRLAEASPGLEGIRAPLEQIPGRELGEGRRSGDASLEPGAPRGSAQDGELNQGTEGSLYSFLDRPYTEAARRALPEWAPRFEADLRRMFGDAVGIRVADRLFTAGTAHPVVQGPVRAEMRGSMDPKKWLIAVALRDTSYNAALQTAVHEGAHYKRQRGSHIADQMSDRDATSAQTNAILKQYGLWNDAEWTVLVDRAKKIGMADRIAEQKVGDKNMLDFYREHYTEQETLLHPYATEGERKLRVDEAIDGELVSHMAEDFVAGRGTFGAKVDGLLARIAKFFEAMRNALHGLGLRTADDVLESAFGDSARKPVEGGERIEPTFGMAPEMASFSSHISGLVERITDKIKAAYKELRFPDETSDIPDSADRLGKRRGMQPAGRAVDTSPIRLRKLLDELDQHNEKGLALLTDVRGQAAKVLGEPVHHMTDKALIAGLRERAVARPGGAERETFLKAADNLERIVAFLSKMRTMIHETTDAYWSSPGMGGPAREVEISPPANQDGPWRPDLRPIDGGKDSGPEMASFSSWMGDKIKNRFLGRETEQGADAGGRPSASEEDASGITAYHGSRADIDQFDLSKVRTGQGYNMFGAGHYLAGVEATGRHYQALFSETGLVRRLLGREKIAHFYEVRINTTKDRMLDADAPISKQPERVQQFVRSVIVPMDWGKAEWMKPDYETLDGAQIYRLGAWSLAGRPPDSFFGTHDPHLGFDQMSRLMSQHGIDGVQFFDAFSRGKKTGTRNFVIFKDDLIKIVRKDGKPVDAQERDAALSAISNEASSKSAEGLPTADETGSGRETGSPAETAKRPSSSEAGSSPQMGEPIEFTAYHGSPNGEVKAFDSARAGENNAAGVVAEGIHFARDLSNARQYAETTKHGRVAQFDLRLEKPFVITDTSGWREIAEQIAPELKFDRSGALAWGDRTPANVRLFTERLKAAGYDGVIADNPGREETIVFDKAAARHVAAGGERAEGLPTTEARVPVSRLDMSPEARKARAEDMGFDTSRVLYHGTDAKFDAFGADKSHPRNEVAGTYFTPDLGEAAGYGNPKPYYVRLRKPLMLDEKWNPVNPAEADAFSRVGIDLNKLLDEQIAGRYGTGQKFTDQLRALGYDGVEVAQGPGTRKNVPMVVVFDPANIRRTNATFDPAQESSPLLMAAFKSSTPDQNRSLDQALSQAADALGIMETVGEPKLAKKPKGKGKAAAADSIRERVLTIANEGGRSLLTQLGEDLTGLAGQHEIEMAKYAFPGVPDPVASGFTNWFKDYVARPEDAKAQAPEFTTAFGDFLDQHNPHLLEALERLQEASMDRQQGREARLGGGGRGALPPIPPPTGGQGTGSGPPQPPVPPVRKLPLPAAVRSAMDGYIRTFQPELFSDAALRADPFFAAYKNAAAHEKDVIVHQAEEHWQAWNKVAEPDQLAYIRRVELGQQQPTDALRNDAFRHRRMLDMAYRMEALYGSKAQYLEEYLPHIYKDPAGVREYFKAMTTSLGPKWFQKQRHFELVDHALAAGFELKSSNPEELVSQRLMAGVDFRQRVELLQQLEQMGMARKAPSAQDDAARQGIGGNGGPPLTEAEAASLPNAGWKEIIAPNNDKWLIAPDVQPLWENAVNAKGLWSNEHAAGSIFRKWMALKNFIVPLKLAISGFHVLHVAHIQMADGLARGWTQLYRGGDLMGALKSASEGWSPVGAAVGGAIGSFGGPVGMAFGAYAGGMVRGARMGQILGFRGKTGGMDSRAAWVKPAGERTPYENEMMTRMHEGGFVPQLSEQLKSSASRSLQEAWAKAQYIKVLPLGLRRGIEKVQAQIFEKWIPTLKASAYLSETAALLKRRPDLMDDNIQRRVAFRAIAKSVDNRFGEMHYGNLFINRTLKDAGIASFLSLGWNLGFMREFGGGAMETVTRRIYKGTASRQTIRDATNKAAFALIYGATSAMGLGMMSWMMTGEQPEGWDFVFPRVGGQNPDGSPRRVTQMSYTREIPMFTKHVQSANSIPGGAAEMLYNKMMIEPFVEMLRNRDYWGYEIYSEEAPLYKQAYQFMKHVAGDQTNPITIAGAKRAAELSGKPFTIGKDAVGYDPRSYDWKGIGESATSKGVGLSMLGFGPAPSYVERKGYENLIGHYYDKYVAPLAKPEEQREIDDAKRYVRNQVALANQRGDAEAAQAARQYGAAQGVKSKQMRGFTTPFAMFQFSKLPANAQTAVLSRIPQSTPEEKTIYDQYRRRALPAVKFQVPAH